MKIPKLAATAAAAMTIAFSSSSFAGVNGWFDKVNVAMVDNAYGWVCDTWLPQETPVTGVLSVYINGSFYRDYSLMNGAWGYSRPDAAYLCNGYSAVGWQIMDWFFQTPGTAMDVYFKYNDGTMQQLGHTIYLQGAGDNY